MLAITEGGPHQVVRSRTSACGFGLFVAAPFVFELGTVFDLSLVFPRMGHAIEVVAVVRWTRSGSDTEPCAMGLDLIELPKGGAAILDRAQSRDSLATRMPSRP